MSHLRSYVAFALHFGVQDFPVQLGVLLRFIALLGRGSHSSKSASNIISSIKWFASFQDPSSSKIFDAVLVSSALKGLKAQLSRPVKQKLPFTVSHMLKFYNYLDLTDAKNLSGWCAMLMAFFGCLRLSNLVPLSCNNFDPLKHLSRDDVSFEDNVMLVCYKWSKTNQNCEKVSMIPIYIVKDPRFNVKTHFVRLFNSCKAKSNAPLFSYDRKLFHSRHSLVNLLNNCASAANLSTSDYSWHSFRRGSAVFAFELGLADSAVQLLGDWSSSAFKNYLEFAFKRKIKVSESIANSFDICLKDCV